MSWSFSERLWFNILAVIVEMNWRKTKFLHFIVHLKSPNHKRKYFLVWRLSPAEDLRGGRQSFHTEQRHDEPDRSPVFLTRTRTSQKRTVPDEGLWNSAPYLTTWFVRRLIYVQSVQTCFEGYLRLFVKRIWVICNGHSCLRHDLWLLRLYFCPLSFSDRNNFVPDFISSSSESKSSNSILSTAHA